jgi:senataxin
MRKQVIGIITPYREQVRRIRQALPRVLTPSEQELVLVSSVDAFQGQEMEVIVISCVRSRGTAATTKSIGFLADPRRLNVAVTRAKKTLAIVGNLSWLSTCDANWAALISYAAKTRAPILRPPTLHASESHEKANEHEGDRCDDLFKLIRLT